MFIFWFLLYLWIEITLLQKGFPVTVTECREGIALSSDNLYKVRIFTCKVVIWLFARKNIFCKNFKWTFSFEIVSAYMILFFRMTTCHYKLCSKCVRSELTTGCPKLGHATLYLLPGGTRKNNIFEGAQPPPPWKFDGCIYLYLWIWPYTTRKKKLLITFKNICSSPLL